MRDKDDTVIILMLTRSENASGDIGVAEAGGDARSTAESTLPFLREDDNIVTHPMQRRVRRRCSRLASRWRKRTWLFEVKRRPIALDFRQQKHVFEGWFPSLIHTGVARVHVIEGGNSRRETRGTDGYSLGWIPRTEKREMSRRIRRERAGKAVRTAKFSRIPCIFIRKVRLRLPSAMLAVCTTRRQRGETGAIKTSVALQARISSTGVSFRRRLRRNPPSDRNR